MTDDISDDDPCRLDTRKPPRHGRFQPGRSGNPAADRKAFAILAPMSNERLKFPSTS